MKRVHQERERILEEGMHEAGLEICCCSLFDSHRLSQIAGAVHLNGKPFFASSFSIYANEFLTLSPFFSAMWKASNCRGMTVRMPCTQSTVLGTRRICFMPARSDSSTDSSAMMIGLPLRAITCCRAFNDFCNSYPVRAGVVSKSISAYLVD